MASKKKVLWRNAAAAAKAVERDDKAKTKLAKANLEKLAESDNNQSYKNRYDLLGDDDSELSQYTELYEEILKENNDAKAAEKQVKASEIQAKARKRDWLELPVDVMSLIFIKLGPLHILHNAQFVCSSWRNLSKEPYFFRSMDLGNTPTYFEYDVEKMAREAVDRSCGQMATFSVDKYFFNIIITHDYDFINTVYHYIVDKSISLERLRFEFDGYQEQTLIEFVEKTPFLEELELFYFVHFPVALIKAVGQSCPQLRYLRLICETYSQNAFESEVLIELVGKLPFLEELELWYQVFSGELIKEIGRSCSQIKNLGLKGIKTYPWGYSDEEAYAITDYIPQLRRLHISFRKLTSIGVEVMLNRCPNLEYLDIEQCVLLDFEGRELLKKKCDESGKTVRLPVYPDYSNGDDSCGRGWHTYWSGGYDHRNKDYHEHIYQDYLYEELFLPKKSYT